MLGAKNDVVNDESEWVEISSVPATFHEAVQTGDPAKIRAVAGYKTWLDHRNSQGGTALHDAANKGDASLVKFLLEEKADTEVPSRDHGMMPLHHAALGGHAHIINLLTEAKADVAAKDDRGNTPLHVARKREAIHALSQAGAPLEARNKDDCTPLQEVVIHPSAASLEAIRSFTEVGADLEAKRCIKEGRFKLCVDLHIDTQYVLNNHSALHRVVLKNDIDAAKELIAAKANLEATDDSHCTALHLSAYFGYNLMVRLLVEANANLNARNNLGCTPLQMAAVSKHVDVAETLLAAKADVHTQTSLGETAFDLACQKSNNEKMWQLLRSKMDEKKSKVTPAASTTVTPASSFFAAASPAAMPINNPAGQINTDRTAVGPNVDSMGFKDAAPTQVFNI
jgi:ankyrin repeat protein